MKCRGIKEVLKNVKLNNVSVVYIADDAEKHVTEGLIRICEEKNIKIIHINTMAELGKKAGIDVGTSCYAE